MPYLFRALGLAGASCVLISAAHAQGKIAAGEIDANLKFLSSDLLEGRAPATRGGQLATAYIASALQEGGVAPGGPNHGYFQAVPIDIVAADPATLHVTASGKATAALRYPDDVVVGAGSAVESSTARGELVFVGYGVSSSSWDDYKGADLHGKVLLVLVNDPPTAPFTKTMDYYGRWTYKYEEAERRGAVGCLIVHTTERAGYPWHTVVGSWAKELRMLPRDPSLPPPLGVRGWITDTAANALLAAAGFDLTQLRTQAASHDFHPVPTGIVMDMAFENKVRHMQSENVIGVVKGTSLPDQYVVFSAHWDHLGIGPAVNGDSIYNGAEDNASGVADVLAMARAAKPQKRSMLFLFVTAEESGLLGSAWFAQHPTVPVAGIVANLNIDGGNLLGRVRDLNVLGEHKSSLGPALAKYVAPMDMHLTPEAHPEQGHFYRSDHFSFAKAGVPALSIGAGTDFVGRPKNWGVEQEDDYTAHRYHQPADEYRPDFDLSGAVQLSTIVLGFGESLANAPGLPAWNADAEFHRQAASSPAAVP